MKLFYGSVLCLVMLFSCSPKQQKIAEEVVEDAVELAKEEITT